MRITYIKTGKRMKDKKIEKTNESNLKKETIKQAKLKSKTENTRSERKEENQNKEERKDIMKTILKKNQIVILTLALMLITAGYMNYNNSMKEMNMSLGELGDAKLVSTNIYDNEIEIASNKIIDNETSNNIQETNGANTNNIIEDKSNQIDNSVANLTVDASTNQKNEASGDYFTQTRLDRESMYSQMLETYQKILENDKVPADQKDIASNEIKNINDRKNAIAIAENLIKTKGFKDVAILINDNSINIVVKQEKNLTEEQVAQITNIISRELKAEIADIHISVHK